MCLRMNSPATNRVGNGGCPGPTRQTELKRPARKPPINLRRQPHQRMAKVDDLLQSGTKQIVLTIVARLAHGSPPTANLAVKGITNRPNPESRNARKRKTHTRLSCKIEYLLSSNHSDGSIASEFFTGDYVVSGLPIIQINALFDGGQL